MRGFALISRDDWYTNREKDGVFYYLAENDIEFSIAAGLIKLYMPGVK